MAWENIAMAFTTGSVLDLSLFPTITNGASWDVWSNYSSKLTINALTVADMNHNYWLCGDSSNGIYIRAEQWSCYWDFYLNGSIIFSSLSDGWGRIEQGATFVLYCGVNHETHEGSFCIMRIYTQSNECQNSNYYDLSNASYRQTLYTILTGNEPISSYISNGGGATHIAKRTGQLKDLSSNLSDILIVSGGGGGGMLIGDTEYAGADAGGISGSGDNSANQSTGYAFGQGESGTDVSGGGGGLYGGYKGVVQ